MASRASCESRAVTSRASGHQRRVIARVVSRRRHRAPQPHAREREQASERRSARARGEEIETTNGACGDIARASCSNIERARAPPCA